MKLPAVGARRDAVALFEEVGEIVFVTDADRFSDGGERLAGGDQHPGGLFQPEPDQELLGR